MDKKGIEKGGIVGIVIIAILGIVFLGVIWNMITDRVTTYSATQNGINVSAVATNILLTSPNADFQEVTLTNSITNATGTDLVTTCNISAHRNLICSVVHNTATNYVNVSYDYVKGGYYTGSLVRTIAPILAILIAVGLLLLIGGGFGKKK
jgi:ABC-type thiamin/hydroxymethylpyrimidine transport system permease subunit